MAHRRISYWLGAIAGLLLMVNGSLRGQTVEVSLSKRSIQGKPVYWDSSLVAILGRDGQLTTFAPDEAREFRKLSGAFQYATASAIRGQLYQEFRGQFDVVGTGQYLVVHPKGQRDRWADRFEELYRNMVHYFRTRGFRLHTPRVPMIAIVFPSRSMYIHYIRENNANVSSNTLGYYDQYTNRIYLYDVTTELADPSLWYINAETIIHEAAHQSAFNVGIHQRFADTPAWVVEGIGTMFEAKGVWNSVEHPAFSTKINRFQLREYRRRVGGRDSLTVLQQQISGDRLFRANVDLAYAHAWALSFYLSERMPRQYAQYLATLSAKKPFYEYSRAERVQDFTAVFGSNWKLFDARLQRFVAEL